MNKIIITKYNNKILTAEVNDKRVLDFCFEDFGGLHIDDIYTGRVDSIAGNIKAAFIEIGEGTKCFYQLKKGEKLNIGDEVLVQIKKDAVKTKDAEGDISLSLPGKYVVVSEGRYSLGISAKIPEGPRKYDIQQLFDSTFSYDDEYNFIIRTNAFEATDEEILAEAEAHIKELKSIRETGSHQVLYKKLFTGSTAYFDKLRDHREEVAVVTDEVSIYEEIKSLFSDIQVELYNDSLVSLTKLYKLESALSDATSRKVWLSSGGYLVIDETEALTVIDVNTGKNDAKGNMEETFFKTNIEAAVESAAQLRLRNISGIVIIDFIDMKSHQKMDELIYTLKKALFDDPVKAVYVDTTKLNLVEITRKKMHKSLREQLN